jgi:hypothetical protein
LLCGVELLPCCKLLVGFELLATFDVLMGFEELCFKEVLNFELNGRGVDACCRDLVPSDGETVCLELPW